MKVLEQKFNKGSKPMNIFQMNSCLQENTSTTADVIRRDQSLSAYWIPFKRVVIKTHHFILPFEDLKCNPKWRVTLLSPLKSMGSDGCNST